MPDLPLAQPVQAGAVGRDHLLDLVLGHAGEVALNHFLRFRPGRIGVRKSEAHIRFSTPTNSRVSTPIRSS